MRTMTSVWALAAYAVIGAAAANAEIVIGLGTPTSGAVAAYGIESQKGAQLAIDDINAAGGVLGQKLALKIGDDACDPKQAVSVANQFVTDKVAAVVGHLCSGSSIPASDVYHEEGLVAVSATATSPTLTDRGYKNIFRVCGRDDQQGPLAGNYIAEKYKGKNVAVLDDKGAYGKGLADEVAKTLEAKGTKIVQRSSVNAGEKDFSALVSKLKDQKIDVVYYGGYHPELGLIVRQSREQGLKAQFIAGDGMNNPEYLSITGPAGDGTLYTDSPSGKLNPAAAKVVDEFKAKGEDVGNFAYYSYAAVQVIAQGLAKAGAVDNKKLSDALHAGSFKTIVGELAFDAKGDLVKPAYVFYEWKNGKNNQL